MIKVSSKKELPKELKNGETIFIDTKGNEKETRRIVDFLKGKKTLIGIYGYDDSFNRRIVETMKINFLINPEAISKDKKDTIKQRDSGINHVVAKEMSKKNISLMIDLREVKTLQKKEKAIVLSRIIQNIKICRKEKCKIGFLLAENLDKKDLESVGYSLGMSSQQLKHLLD